MTSRLLHPRALAASIVLHVAVATAVLVLIREGARRGRFDVPIPPERLVWVEPAPRAPVATSGPAVAEAVGPPDSAALQPPPVVAHEPTKHAASRAPARQPSRPRRAEKTEPAVPAAVDAPVAADAPARREMPGGAAAPLTSGGRPDGAVGGLGDAPVAVATVTRPPELVERVVPEYPARARALEIEGRVLLEIVLDRDGRPESDIRVVDSVPALDAAAVAAVRRWRFRPARDPSGRAVRVIMQVPVRFELR